MDMKDGINLGIVLALVWIALMVGMFWGGSIEGRHFRIEAVKVGAAEWVSNPDGSTTFKWK